MEKLFRKEALQARTGNHSYSLIKVPGETINSLIVLIFVVLVAITIASCYVQFPRLVVATGTLKSKSGSVKMYLTRAAIIEKVLVSDDYIVSKGDPLAIVHLNAEQSMDNHAQQNDLELRLKQLAAQLENEAHQYQHILANLDRRYHLTEAELDSLRTSIELQQRLVQHNRDEIDAIKTLIESGSSALNEMRHVEQRLIQSELTLYDYRLNQHQVELRLNHITRERLAAEISYQQNYELVVNERNSLQLKLTQLRNELRYELTAQSDGIVTNLQITDGQYWHTNQPILQLLPIRKDLYAELVVPSRHRGFVAKDTAVVLTFDAFPHQQYGVGHGVITEIANASLDSTELRMHHLANEPMYRIKVSLQSQAIENSAQDFPLLEGMKTTARLHLESRTLIEWFFEPIKGLMS